MGRIVILNGSPRKDGNTSRLVEAFCEGAKEQNEVEIISVAGYEVHPCIGCNSCFKSEGNRCFRQDDMQQIYEKLAEADALVIASPGYFYGISAQLKAVADRLHTPLRNSFKIKKTALLLVAGAGGDFVFNSIKEQYRLIVKFFNLTDAGTVTVTGVREKGDINGNPALKKAYELGKSI